MRLMPRWAAIADGERVMQSVAAVNPATNQVVVTEAEVIPKIADQQKAWAKLGDIGLGENISKEDVHARLITQCAVIRELCGPSLGEQVIERLAKVWK
jgi:hypothetical protein